MTDLTGHLFLISSTRRTIKRRGTRKQKTQFTKVEDGYNKAYRLICKLERSLGKDPLIEQMHKSNIDSFKEAVDIIVDNGNW
jgi:hypothetical protein